MVDDGVSFQSGDLGSDMLQTELEPLVEGDDSGGFLGENTTRISEIET